MSVEEIILYLRQQLLELRGDNDRQAISELLSTFKMLTKISFENNDKQLIAVLVSLTDAARDLYLNHPLSNSIPTETEVRQAVDGTTTEAVAVASPVAVASTNGSGKLTTDTRAIKSITTQEIGALETSFDQESRIQQALRAVSNRNWKDHTVIRDGSKRQMQAYSVVYDELMLFHHLTAHAPLWTGTFPLDLDTADSDIDIICNPESLRPFLLQVKSLYGNQTDFRLTWKAIDRVPTVLARFTCNGFPVELFAQPRPTTSQQSFVHMVVEARLLAIGGPEAREGIRELKSDGYTTEEAFVKYFKIPTDDPYEKLLSFARLDNDSLRRQIGIEIGG
jgi:hypothetical protein